MSDCMDAGRRAGTLDEIEKAQFDLIVIGGGITGAGILREASLRGLSTLLIEAEDFSSGTSSKSTKLIHGGIRYLAMGDFGVVRQAGRERKRVHRLAPHLAEPRLLMLPARSRLEYLKYRFGVSLYEFLGDVDAADRHFNVTREGLSSEEPSLDTNAFPYACLYREYLTDDARLVLGNVRAGIAAGGIAVNYLAATGLIKDHARVTGVRATCALTGREVVVHARGVINAAGPWVESICEFDGLAPPKSLVLSKGIHVVVPRERLPIKHPTLMVTKDNRPEFAIPREDVVYLGTTDTPHPGKAEHWPVVRRRDLEYLFEAVRRYYGIGLTFPDCRMTWAGLRPLIAEPGKATKDISRRDEIWISQSGLLTIAGGKLTGYRKMAEDTVDRAVKTLDLTARAPSEDTPLPGGDFHGDVATLATAFAGKAGVDSSTAERMARLYGSEAEDVLALGPAPVTERGMVREGEIRWAVGREGALALEDVLYRRTRAAIYRPDEMLVVIEPVSRIMATLLGWNEDERLTQVKSTRDRFLADTNFDVE